jgi:hypothetical protein
MNMHYLVDFDLDSDTCECGEPCATHPALAAPRPLTEHPGRDDGPHVFSREWRATGTPGPHGPGIQVRRPAKRARGDHPGPHPNRIRDDQLARVIQGDPSASYATIAEALGVSRQAVYVRLQRMERDGVLSAEVARWRDHHARALR